MNPSDETLSPAPTSAPQRWMQWGALAASVLVGVMIGRLSTSSDDADHVFMARSGDALIARGALELVLTEQASGTALSGMAPGFSYRTQDGEYCRTFTMIGSDPLAGIACRSAQHWVVEAVASTDESAETDYRMASTALPANLRLHVEADIDGDPLDAAAEAAAIAHNWR